MKRSFPVLLLLLMSASTTLAQVEPSGPTQAMQTVNASEDLILTGMLDGRMAANRKGTGGYFAGGLVGGVTLGLIGTGIAWGVAAASDPSPSQTESLLIRKKGTEYAVAYDDAYSDRLKQRRKRKAVTGGIIGTGVIVAVILSSY